MTTLTVESNRTTARNAGEQDFTSIGYLHARRRAESARAEAVAKAFGKLFRRKPKQASTTVDVPYQASGPLDAFSLAEQERMARAQAMGETLASATKAVTSAFAKAAAAPKAGPAVDMSRFAHLSKREQADIERALAISDGISSILVGLEHLVRDLIVNPISSYLTRQRLMNELSSLSERTLADIGVRRIDIATAAQDAYPIYMTGSAAGIESAAANDDLGRRHVA